MKGYDLRRLMSFLSNVNRMGSGSIELLVPKWKGCAVCGKTVHASGVGNGNPAMLAATHPFLRQSLCTGCRASIPWLERITCSVCGRAIRCEDCIRRPLRPFVCNRSAVAYTAEMRDWLARYKYRGDERLAPLLAEMLVPVLLQLTKETGVEGGRKLNRCWDAVTYVPISEERAKERGFNQAKQMAEHLSARFHIPLCDLLIRERHTGKMSFKKRSERMRDAATLFDINEAGLKRLENLAGKEPRILLVDDIYTTGSTAEACSAVLHRYAVKNISVFALTWARS